ncbi:MAG TPA: YkgJ family cysteine cluster protein [Methanotrichaceae archaeon]|nr:YkgJ family cysteine cluster protein [Methanotrichaceae archaeon]
MSWKEERIRELSSQLEAARSIPLEKIASEIRKIGFQCTRCGECCKGDENSVVVFPFEMRRIATRTGEPWQETVEPPCTGEWDSQGNFHTLEWRIKKRCGSCRYYKTDKGCQVYEDRPLLCSTYPFYIEDGALSASECRGLGLEIGMDEARELASRLIGRHKTEIEEAMALVENYSDFDRGGPRCDGQCIVHDSEGEHRIAWTPELLRRCRDGHE